MKQERFPNELGAPITEMRQTAAARVQETSLREVAEEIGTSLDELKQFLIGGPPNSPALQRLRRWFAQQAPASVSVAKPDAAAAIGVLVYDLAESPRSEIAREILTSLARGYTESGKDRPDWITELSAQYGGMAEDAAVGRTRPSAFGKYRERIGSSEDYAQFKQGEIDREDRRSA